MTPVAGTPRRGFFAIGVWHPKHSVNVGTLWRSAWNWNAAFVFTVGRRYAHQPGDTTATPQHVPLFHFADVDDLIAHLPHSCPLVGVEQDPRSRALSAFAHPRSAAYLLGAEDSGLSAAVRNRCHFLVEVPGTRSCLNVAVAGSVVLYDRHSKVSFAYPTPRSLEVSRARATLAS